MAMFEASGLRGAWVTEESGAPSHLSEAPDVAELLEQRQPLADSPRDQRDDRYRRLSHALEVLQVEKALSMPHGQRDGTSASRPCWSRQPVRQRKVRVATGSNRRKRT